MKTLRSLNNASEILFLVTGGIFLLGFLAWRMGFDGDFLGMHLSGEGILSTLETPLFLFALTYLLTSFRLALVDATTDSDTQTTALQGYDLAILVIIGVLFVSWLLLDVFYLEPLPARA